MNSPAEIRAAAQGALELLDTYGPDHEQEDDQFVAVRAALRRSLDWPGPYCPAAGTMDWARLSSALAHAWIEGPRGNPPVRLIVNGIAYPVEDVWFEPNQEGPGQGSICIGVDPR